MCWLDHCPPDIKTLSLCWLDQRLPQNQGNWQFRYIGSKRRVSCERGGEEGSVGIHRYPLYVRERVNHIWRMVLLCATQQGGQPTTWDPVISPTHFFRGTPSSYRLGPLQFAHINGVFHRV